LGKHSRILVADDDESIRKILAVILEDRGYAVDTAENGKQAIELSKNNFYNLALIDIRLPDMEGTRLLSSLRETVPRMRKVIITGFPSMQNAVEALNKGADAYVTKPFEVEKILKTIKEQLAKQQKEKKFSQDKVTEFIQTRVKELEETKPVTHRKPK
jgi:DNA-binding NtrC family response regulator